ncbi:MAG: class I SAM-dependent methyltransferase [Candidatus Solibacter sp.]
MTPKVDDWDQHWTEFLKINSVAPATEFRRRTVEKLLEIQGTGKGVRILEIGAGTGTLAEEASRTYPDAAFLGLDLSAISVKMCKKRVPTAEFRQRNLLEPPGPEDNLEFGATHVVCSEVLEHVDDPVLLLRSALPYMAPGCKLVFTVPGGAISAFHKNLGHRRHYTAELLSDTLKKAGLRVKWSSGVGFPFFNIYWSLIVWRGEKAIQEVAGEPGLAIRALGKVFGWLFHLTTMRAGWQIAGVAEYQPAK